MSSENITKIIKYIGKNIKPSYPIVLVAAAEIVFRPMFTMMDKKSPAETKKYTALREAITEVVAVPTYLACGALAAKGATLFKDPQKKIYAKHNLELLGLWTAALIVIPGLCSAVVKPFTEKLFNKNKPQKTPEINTIKPLNENLINGKSLPYTGNIISVPKTAYNGVIGFKNYGMRVG